MEETILVCVTVQKECQRLILAGKRLAESANLPMKVLHVAPAGGSPQGNPESREALDFLFAISRDTGAEMTVLFNDDVRAAIVDFARQNHAICVVVGSDPQRGWQMAEALEELLEDNITIMRA